MAEGGDPSQKERCWFFSQFQYRRGCTLLLLTAGKTSDKERKGRVSAVTLDQQNRALEAATVALRYFTALCPPMGKTLVVFDLHFLAKPGSFQANYCNVTKVEVPNCVLTCNMRNEFVPVRVYQAVKNPATTDEFAAYFSFMLE